MNEIDVIEAHRMMTKMWNKADLFQKRIENTEKRIKKFGIRRWIFFWKFFYINEVLLNYQLQRDISVEIAIVISKKLSTIKNIRIRYDN